MNEQLNTYNGFNKHKKISSPYHLGCTVSLRKVDLIGYITKSNCDSEGLGRYAWQLFRGRATKKLRKLTCYQPFLPYLGGEIHSLYKQYLSYFSELLRKICLGKAFIVDLYAEIADGKKRVTNPYLWLISIKYIHQEDSFIIFLPRDEITYNW